MKKQFHRIESNPRKQQGRPCIKGTRITVYDILDYLSAGMSAEEITENYPPLTKADIREAVDFVKYMHSHTQYLRSSGAASRP